MVKEGREGTVALRSTKDDVGLEFSDTENLGCENPEAVKSMFGFMYLLTYGGSTSCSDDDTPADAQDLCLHANVYALGEKYGIATLKDVSLQKFAQSARGFWKSDAFRNAVMIVFTSTPDHDKGLRDVVLRVLSLHRREMAGDAQVGAIIREIDGLAFDLWKMNSVLPGGPTCNVCQSVYIRVCRAGHRRTQERFRRWMLPKLPLRAGTLLRKPSPCSWGSRRRHMVVKVIKNRALGKTAGTQ